MGGRQAPKSSCCAPPSVASRKCPIIQAGSITSHCWCRAIRRPERSNARHFDFAFLAPCFAASLILAGNHAYSRPRRRARVIFVDLSLAQIARWAPHPRCCCRSRTANPHAPMVYWSGLRSRSWRFVFSTIRSQARTHSQEAIIGICYAVRRRVDSGDEQATSESEHLKDMLVGTSSRSRGPRYEDRCPVRGIGAFHYVFRHKSWRSR